jgi:hypothetical protein
VPLKRIHQQGIENMNGNFHKYLSRWVSFSYLSFGAAAVVLAGGFHVIAKTEQLPIDLTTAARADID